MITAAKLRGLSVGAREGILAELHWWNHRPWPFLTPLIDVGIPEDDLRQAYGRVAFFYEAAARFDAPRGVIKWSQGKPFGQLAFQEIDAARKAFPEAERWTITFQTNAEPLEVPPGEWSRPVIINLRSTWKELEETLKPHLDREREVRGVKPWRREIPWRGLELFDRRLARLVQNGENPTVAIKRAREYYLDREANR